MAVRAPTGPSFSGLSAASDMSSRSKRANRKTGSSIENLLAKELWKNGMRYRRNSTRILGNPDIVFKGAKVAIFCDGDFWHGKNWSELRRKLERGWNGEYWLAKIERNIERDKAVSESLRDDGWIVLRFWESDLQSDIDEAVTMVIDAVESRSGIPFTSIKGNE